jgi:hypothetical protein
MKNWDTYNLSKNGTELTVRFSTKKKQAIIHVHCQGESYVDDLALLTKGWVTSGWEIEVRP